MKNLIYIACCSTLLCSCGIMKDYERPADLTRASTAFTATPRPIVLRKQTPPISATLPWQEVFTDPYLQKLINKALANNADLRSADIAVKQAEASLKVARLAYYPAISFNPRGAMTSWDFNKATKTYSVPLAASWQFNLFSLRNNKKKAQTGLEMTKAYKQAARTSIIAGVANMYYTLQMLDEQLKTTRGNRQHLG